MEEKKVYMGIDIGTNSCGWAVTNQDYEILKRSGKSLHGVRLIKEAQTAENRRIKRSARRRIDRRKHRIELLQELFLDELSKVDPLFFLRLNNSKYHFEDKDTTSLGKYTLFNDENYTDKDYYNDYKTIYHLRNHLMTCHEKPDIRLLYLACHHIIKYRGNFLMQGANINTQSSDIDHIVTAFNRVITSLNDIIGEHKYTFFADKHKITKLQEAFVNSKNTTETTKLIVEIFDEKKNKDNKHLAKLIAGQKVALKDLFFEDSYKNVEPSSIKFSENTFDEDLSKLEEVLDQEIQILLNAKEIYNWLTLKKLLGSKNNVSESMIDKYEKHKKDLRILKNLYKKYLDSSSYRLMFKDAKQKNNYVAYVNTNLVNNRKLYVENKRAEYEDFAKNLKKVFEKIDDQAKKDDNYKYAIEELTAGTFLPRLRQKDNAVIPYQLHQNELKEILNNMEKYYSFLKTEDAKGISVSEKIIMLLTFKIPYYVGPLNDAHKDHNGFAWVVRKESGAVKPWNFEEKVDINASAEAFITRMTNKCTYLIGKDVLPKHSLLYSEFRVLNELNKISLNGNPISVEEKMFIYNNVFKKYKKITINLIKRVFKNAGKIKTLNDLSIQGIDGDFKNALTSYIDFSNIFGKVDYSNQELIEEIIFLITIFEDKSRLEYELKSRLKLPSESIKQIKGLTYKGWGSLSKELLNDEVYRINEQGECISIMTLMRNENLNLQQAIYDPRYKFNELIENINKDLHGNKSISYDALVKDLYLSPAIKTSIWQSIRIVEEVKKIIAPKKIDRFFVECSRGKGIKRPTTSRRKFIENLYDKTKKQLPELIKMQGELALLTDEKLRSDKLFFYFIQLGKCAYTGESIDLDRLFTGHYDIDHIVPRAYLKDNSLDNRVLVANLANKLKADKYPIVPEIQNKMKPVWKQLVELGLMTKQKYALLTRKHDLEAEEIGTFINRQLVFTNQTVKAVIDILNMINEDSKVIYAKASNVSDFRNQFDILKCREINDLHHAEDAYLNIVVGNTYYCKYGTDARIFMKTKDYQSEGISTYKLFARNTAGAWDKENTLPLVKKEITKKDKLITNMTYEVKGQFYDETIYPKGSDLFPLKTKANSPLSNVNKYGGFKSLKNAYFVICESTDKKKSRILTIEGIPVLFAKRIEMGLMTLESVLIDYLGLIEPKVIVNKIKINTLMNIGQSYVYLSGRSGDSILFQNASQMFVDKFHSDYIRLIIKHKDTYRKLSEILDYNDEKYVVAIRSGTNDEITKENNTKLLRLIRNQLSKPIYSDLPLRKYGDQIEAIYSDFEKLNVRIQAHILREALHFVERNSTTSDLSLVMDKASKLGNIQVSKKIGKKPLSIIDQSVTGFYHKTRWSFKSGL